MHPIREARLRPEFADLYDGLTPGVWYAAATVAEFLITRAATLQANDDATQRRLNTEHFEFRGGSPSGVRGRPRRDGE